MRHDPNDQPLPSTHNGGPPLDDDPRPWGPNGIGNYFEWAAAKKKAFDVPYDIAIMRARRAEALGLTYDASQAVGAADARLRWSLARQEGHEGYARMAALEILERGRYLSAADAERIAEIRRRRPL